MARSVWATPEEGSRVVATPAATTAAAIVLLRLGQLKREADPLMYELVHAIIPPSAHIDERVAAITAAEVGEEAAIIARISVRKRSLVFAHHSVGVRVDADQLARV